MAQTQGNAGPASLLKSGSNWLDSNAQFVSRDLELAAAAKMVWAITRKLRGAQGERNLSTSSLSIKANLRRQTVAQALMGEVWPDIQTLTKLCSTLGLELNLIEKV